MADLPLPEPLQPWREWLEWFEPDIAPDVGDLVRRLHPLLGRFHGQQQGGQPEPDGLGDLLRRGSYERLLGSEWLLAEEMPDEFLRRAAGGEHLFLAPKPRAHQAERLIFALFDAGPRQLGAPRLAHLALWILLSRRAQEAGGELRWGVIQGRSIKTGSSVEELKALLRARTYESPKPEHWQHWQEWVAELDAAPGECWLIGHTYPEQQTQFSHVIQLNSSLDGKSLEVMVQQSLSKRQLTLPLPADKACLKILKGEFQKISNTSASTHAQNPHRLAVTLAPFISPHSQLVAVPLLDEHGVMIFKIPRKGAKPAKSRRQIWSANSQPLTAVFNGRQFGALLSSQDSLHFWQIDLLGICPRPDRNAFEASAGRARLLPGAWLKWGNSHRLYVIDNAKRLVRWTKNKQETQPSFLTINTVVLAVAPVSPVSLVYLAKTESGLVINREQPRPTETNYQLSLNEKIDGAAFFGGGPLWVTGFGLCAIRIEQGSHETWRIYTPKDGKALASQFAFADVKTPQGWEVMGVVHEPNSASGFGLLLLGPQKNAIALFNGQNSEALYMTAHPILRHSVCPISGNIALLTDERELIVYSTADRAVRLFVHSRGSMNESS